MTVAGTPIKFRDNHSWYNDIPTSNANYDIEARWDENGAICLNEPRVDFQGGAVNFLLTDVIGVAPCRAWQFVCVEKLASSGSCCASYRRDD